MINHFSIWSVEVLITGAIVLLFVMIIQKGSVLLNLPPSYRYDNLKLAIILILIGPIWSIWLPNGSRESLGIDYLIAHFFHGRSIFLASLRSVLLFFYFVGLSYFIYRMCRSIAGARKIVSQAELLDIKDSYYPVYASKDIDSPISLGLFDPKILLPKRFREEFADSRMRIVLAHEGIHIARRDHLFRGLLSVVSLFWYFSPLTNILKNEFDSEMELSCDSTLLTSGFFAPRQYGEVLVSIAELRTQRLGDHGIAMSRSFLRKRLESMKRHAQRPKLISQFLLTCGLVTFAAGVSAFGIDTPALYRAPESTIAVESGDSCPDLQTCSYNEVSHEKNLHIACTSGLLNVNEAYYEANGANLSCLNYAQTRCDGTSQCDLVMTAPHCGTGSNRPLGDSAFVKVSCSGAPGTAQTEFGTPCGSGFTCKYFGAHESIQVRSLTDVEC